MRLWRELVMDSKELWYCLCIYSVQWIMILLVFLARTVCDVTWSNNGSNKNNKLFSTFVKKYYYFFLFWLFSLQFCILIDTILIFFFVCICKLSIRQTVYELVHEWIIYVVSEVLFVYIRNAEFFQFGIYAFNFSSFWFF